MGLPPIVGGQEAARLENLRQLAVWTARPRPQVGAGVYLHLLADRGVDELGQLSAMAGMDEPDEVAEEGRVDPLAAFVGGDPGELEEFVDLRL
jgi:hypothetical protein